jgi:hypothetical protein
MTLYKAAGPSTASGRLSSSPATSRQKASLQGEVGAQRLPRRLQARPLSAPRSSPATECPLPQQTLQLFPDCVADQCRRPRQRQPEPADGGSAPAGACRHGQRARRGSGRPSFQPHNRTFRSVSDRLRVPVCRIGISLLEAFEAGTKGKDNATGSWPITDR